MHREYSSKETTLQWPLNDRSQQAILQIGRSFIWVHWAQNRIAHPMAAIALVHMQVRNDA